MVLTAENLDCLDAFGRDASEPEGQVFPRGAISQIPFPYYLLNHYQTGSQWAME